MGIGLVGIGLVGIRSQFYAALSNLQKKTCKKKKNNNKTPYCADIMLNACTHL